jgi:pSer/pThr/pTyr-binding forkhead associated (FHA) protein
MSTLTITTGPSVGQSIECDRELVVGREDVDLVVEDSEMSRRHASIRPVAAGLEIEDLGSLNGTFLDGERITGAALVTANATLKMGVTSFALELSASDVPLADPQRTVASEIAREQPVVDVTDRTTVRPTPAEPVAAAEPVADVSDHTTIRPTGEQHASDEPIVDVTDRTVVRDVPAEPVAEVSDRTTVRPTPQEVSDRTTVRPAREQPIVEISDSTVVRDAPVFDVPDRTVVRDVAAPPAGTPPPAAAPGGSPPGAGAPGAPPFAGPPGPLPPPVRILMKSPVGKRLLPLLVRLPPRARPIALALIALLFVVVLVAIVVVIVEVL